MAKVTSKLQVTVPKQIADQYGIKPGDDIEWVASGDSIRVLPGRRRPPKKAVPSRLRLFDQATQRQQIRNEEAEPATGSMLRGWSREELYGRGNAR